MIGYKGFNADRTCLGFQYQLGATYKIPETDLQLCRSGFHFCQFPVDVLLYYPQSDAVYAEVRADGKIIKDDNKCVTNKITLIRQLSKEELMALTPPVIQRPNRKEWYSKGQLHRKDGPAIEWIDGSKAWYQQGYLHRTDGPAVEYPSYKAWCCHGKIHRIDGPAVEWTDGDKEWFFEDQKHRTDGPAVERANGDKEWWVHGTRQNSPHLKETEIAF